jgi:hypothetical protein
MSRRKSVKKGAIKSGSVQKLRISGGSKCKCLCGKCLCNSCTPKKRKYKKSKKSKKSKKGGMIRSGSVQKLRIGNNGE